MTKRHGWMFALAFTFVSTTAHSANLPSSDEIKGKINQALAKGNSLKNFYSSLGQQYGGSAIKPLIDIANDDKNSDETRWASIFGLARLAGKESVGMLSKFMNNTSWMIRDAALKAAAALNARELKLHIERRLKDDALIVRTTAVQTISHLKLKDSAPRLVEALFDPNNFNKGKALWIHKHILNTLKEFHYTAASPRLADLLQKTQDETLQAHVVKTLESLTGRSFPNKPIQEQIYLWKRNTISEVTF